MTHKPEAPATDRNRESILEVLKIEFERSCSVLEIGSGTGQHAVFFGRELPWLRWQTSDRLENHDGINAWLSDSRLPNVSKPLHLDVEQVDQLADTYDAVFSANTAHIMSFAAVQCMFRLVGRCLSSNGKFCLYGPFNVNGEYTSESNKAFDESLKLRDPLMGIRDLDALQKLAAENKLTPDRKYAMPANNMLIVWRSD
jgi:SAM-dependent methyltransferase